MPLRALVAIPTGWSLNSVWQIRIDQWMNEPRTSELEKLWEPSNTKAVSYSNIVDKAREGRYDYLVLLETNILPEISFQNLIYRARQFDCAFSPGRVEDRTVGADPIFSETADVRSLPVETVSRRVVDHDGIPTEESVEELMPFECHWGCTHLVVLSRKALQSFTPRFTWAKQDAKLDRDIPIYAYDGDTMPDHPEDYVKRPDQGNPVRRLSIEQSFFSNLRAAGIGVWADPRLYSTNLRLGGAYRSLRLADVPHES